MVLGSAAHVAGNSVPTYSAPLMLYASTNVGLCASGGASSTTAVSASMLGLLPGLPRSNAHAPRATNSTARRIPHGTRLAGVRPLTVAGGCADLKVGLSGLEPSTAHNSRRCAQDSRMQAASAALVVPRA